MPPVATATTRASVYNAAYHAAECPHRDPLATLDADVDPTPGREHVIGNRRFGVAMFAERGELIALMKPIGCAVNHLGGDASISLGYESPRLIVRARRLEHEGELYDAHVDERRGDVLETVATIDIGGHRFYRGREWDVDGKLYMSSESIEVKYHGRERLDGHEWREVDEHCTWQLGATPISSCHTRAGARTSERE